MKSAQFLNLFQIRLTTGLQHCCSQEGFSCRSQKCAHDFWFFK